MTARFVALIVAAAVLSACETTSVSDQGAAPKKRIVVRGEVVPDDPAPSVQAKKSGVKKAVRTASAASAGVSTGEMAPVIDATPDVSSDDTTSAVAPGSSGGSGTGTGAGTGSDLGAGSTGGDTSTLANTSADPSEAAATPLGSIEPAPIVSAEPANAPPPTPSPFAIDFREMMNATIAGFPLWLMVVVAIVLAGALVFGTGGRRERARDERDYDERTYPEREPHYDDTSYDDEPRGAEPQPA